MNHVVGHQERNTQPRFLYRDLLDLIDPLHVRNIPDPANGPLADHRLSEPAFVRRIQQDHLPDLLLQCHSPEKLFDALLNFRRLIIKALRGEDEDRVYEIAYFDTGSSSTKKEKVPLNSFITHIRKKAKIFNALSMKVSTAYKRLESASEDQIYNFLNKEIGELQIIHRRLNGLNSYFYSEIPANQKDKLRGIGTVHHPVI